MSEKNQEKKYAIESIIVSAVQIPGVKVNRNKFLAEVFANEGVNIQEVLEVGPIEAKLSQERLRSISSKLILKRTSQSSIASFAAGIPGGLAMAATIPADVLQFFGMSLRLAQELSYIYGAQDLWHDGQIDDERVKNQLLLYCGVMFGVSGAVSGVRVLSTQIAKTTLRKLPQKALTKTFWYPILKKISMAIGLKITKSTVAQGFSKAIPVLGGVISGGLNFASMMPMAKRLQTALDSASFEYTDEDLQKDLLEIEAISESASSDTEDKNDDKKVKRNLSGLFAKKKTSNIEEKENPIETIKKLSEMKDCGIITDKEFEDKKAELLAKL